MILKRSSKIQHMFFYKLAKCQHNQTKTTFGANDLKSKKMVILKSKYFYLKTKIKLH